MFTLVCSCADPWRIILLFQLYLLPLPTFHTSFTLRSWLASLFPNSTKLWRPSLSTFLPFAEILFLVRVKVRPILSALWNLAHPPPGCRINLSHLSHHIIIIWLHFNWIIRKTALCILGNVNERRKNEERNYKVVFFT